MKTQQEILEIYLKQGHTQREFSEQIQKYSGSPCLVCKDNPIYIALWMDDSNILVFYTLCKNCLAKLRGNEEDFTAMIEKMIWNIKNNVRYDRSSYT